MDLGLKNRIALVAASSKGLGRACAEALAAEGAKVAICARNEAELMRAREEMAKTTGAEILAMVADMKNAADIARVVEQTVAHFGGLHILVTNAGGPPGGDFFDFDDAAWQGAVDLTLMSTVRLIRAAVPHMQAARMGKNHQHHQSFGQGAAGPPGALERASPGGSRPGQDPCHPAGEGRNHGEQHHARLYPDRPDHRIRKGDRKADGKTPGGSLCGHGKPRARGEARGAGRTGGVGCLSGLGQSGLYHRHIDSRGRRRHPGRFLSRFNARVLREKKKTVVLPWFVFFRVCAKLSGWRRRGAASLPRCSTS